MARFPTFDEYRDKPAKGVQRCDELLRRDPSNVSILLTKLQLQAAQSDVNAARQTLDRLYASKIPILDLSEIATIEEAVVELNNEIYPPSLSAGPEVAKLWDVAYKATSSVNHKLDLQSLRFTRALIDNRLLDAQQSLIQLKVLSPKNRVFYMAHIALTQMLSTSKDDLQSRLAITLARKAVSERFDDQKDLDCRVPGQIFAAQGATKDIESILASRFADSKQVFDTQRKTISSTGKQTSATNPDTVAPKVWLNSELLVLKGQFRDLVSGECTTVQLQSFAANAIRLFVTATQSLSLQSYRPVSEAIFLAISALVKAWTLDAAPAYLLQSTFLAECLVRLQPKVHEAKVILVYLYARLGLGRSAYLEWDSLKTKEIQYDTFGHTFLSQLSIIHPHYLTDIDPVRIIAHGLGVYRRLEDKLLETHASVLSHGQTGMIFDLHELRERLRLSTTRRILSLEQRRLGRLHSAKLTEQSIYVHPRLTAAWLDTKDNRDFSAAFDYGFEVERALHQQDETKTWLLFSLAADSLWCLISDQLPLVKDTTALLTQIEALSTRDATPDYEWVVGELIVSALTMTLALQKDGQTELKDKLLHGIEALHIEALIMEADKLPLRIRCVYLYLDALLLLAAFIKYAESKNALTKQEATIVRDALSTALKQLQAYCRDNISAVDTSAIRSCISSPAQESVFTELAPLGADNLTSFCASIAEASKDAWAGAVQYRI
ncbi:hypothetical protein AMS68_005575 [Peltaster fructicola]|uniref:Uncharacterized protein n=1 Tax=Peltaster fructicola TaxID=286661 RepID=A0A6H0XZN4_9PEZI|nr:hypothetical protein AMS68_005575 [Peltaster fructicola]